MMSKVMTATEY